MSLLYEDRFLLIRARARMELGMTVLVTYGDGPGNDDGSREAPALPNWLSHRSADLAPVVPVQ